MFLYRHSDTHEDVAVKQFLRNFHDAPDDSSLEVHSKRFVCCNIFIQGFACEQSITCFFCVGKAFTKCDATNLLN